MEHLLKWLKSTINYGVEFVHTPKSPLIPEVASYSDSSHNDCPDTSGSLAEISDTDISEGKLPLHPKAMGRMAAEVGSMQVLPTPAASPFFPLGVLCTRGLARSLFE